MENLKRFNWIIIAIVALLVFMFYWQFIRPAQIKKSCYQKSSELVNQPKLGQYLLDEKLKAIDILYKHCLRAKGL